LPGKTDIALNVSPLRMGSIVYKANTAFELLLYLRVAARRINAVDATQQSGLWIGSVGEAIRRPGNFLRAYRPDDKGRNHDQQFGFVAHVIAGSKQRSKDRDIG